MQKYYCIEPDCNNEISRTSYYGKRRCKNCYCKKLKNEGNPNFKDGKTLKKYYCIDCGDEITVSSGVYGQGRCGSCARKGLKPNKSSIEKRRQSMLKFWNSSEGQELKKKISKKFEKEGNPNFDNHKLADKNNPSYINGEGNFPYPLEFNDKLKLKIRKRDNYICQKCNITEEEHLSVYGTVLAVHHIDYNKENCDESNLIALCNECNLRVNFNRDYWFAYFTYLIDLRLNLKKVEV